MGAWRCPLLLRASSSVPWAQREMAINRGMNGLECRLWANTGRPRFCIWLSATTAAAQKTNHSRRRATHAMISHCIWYKISGGPKLVMPKLSFNELLHPIAFKCQPNLLDHLLKFRKLTIDYFICRNFKGIGNLRS